MHHPLFTNGYQSSEMSEDCQPLSENRTRPLTSYFAMCTPDDMIAGIELNV